MENTLRGILHNYPIHPWEIMSLKFERIWKITAKEGTYILKALPYPERETGFIIGAMEHLKEQGFDQFNQIIPKIDHSLTVKFENRFYFLSKEISGREASFNSADDAIALGKFLGAFHKSTKGYIPELPYVGRVKWHHWYDMIEQKKEDMRQFKEICPKQGEFHCLCRRYTDYYLNETEKAQPIFNSNEYHILCEEGEKCGGFCHHDLAHHNFLLADTVNIIDFDYVVADIRCHDLANITGKILKANHWDTEIAMTFLTAYDKENTLSKEEPKIIKAMLRFPQDYWQCLFACYREENASSRNEKKLCHWIKERTLRKEGLRLLESLF